MARAATLLGVRRATLSDVLNGHASLSAEMALRLEKAFGVSMDLLLKMQAGYDAAQARLTENKIKVKRYVSAEGDSPRTCWFGVRNQNPRRRRQ
ncbi:MAG: HigA family addiction module antitoxin [Acidobacteriota bacterium]